MQLKVSKRVVLNVKKMLRETGKICMTVRNQFIKTEFISLLFFISQV